MLLGNIFYGGLKKLLKYIFGDIVIWECNLHGWGMVLENVMNRTKFESKSMIRAQFQTLVNYKSVK